MLCRGRTNGHLIDRCGRLLQPHLQPVVKGVAATRFLREFDGFPRAVDVSARQSRKPEFRLRKRNAPPLFARAVQDTLRGPPCTLDLAHQCLAICDATGQPRHRGADHRHTTRKFERQRLCRAYLEHLWAAAAQACVRRGEGGLCCCGYGKNTQMFENARAVEW